MPASVAYAQCTVSLPTKQRDVLKEEYVLHLQNEMEGGMVDPPEGDGIRVKCWKSLPTGVTEPNRFLTPFQLQIGSRCDLTKTNITECKANNQTLPFISYLEDGLMVTTSDKDLNSKIDAPGNDMVQVGHIDFDAPTLDYITKLPVPVIFAAGNFESEKNKIFEV